MTKPRFRQINIADIPDAAIDSISDTLQVPKLLRPGSDAVVPPRQPSVALPRQTSAEPSRRPSVATKDTLKPPSTARHKLTVRLPQSLNDAMKRDALDHRTHVSVIILCALQLAGYLVPNADLLAPDATARLRFALLTRQSVVAPSSLLQAGPSAQQKLTIHMPGVLEETLKRDALTGRTTVRAMVLRALQAFGYPVADADLAPGAGGNC